MEPDFYLPEMVTYSPPNVRYRQPWTNWGETAQCTPELTFYPQCIEDLIHIVCFARATERKIRVAGTGHSWSALVPTDEILVCIHRLNRVAMDLSDESRPRVVVESGTTVKEVNDVLEAYGYALPLNVVLESVRFGGLIATGSHGSGWSNPTLSDLVSSIEIITATGELRKFEMGVDSDEIMNAARLNLGLFGIIYRLTLDVQGNPLVPEIVSQTGQRQEDAFLSKKIENDSKMVKTVKGCNS
jgi:FAD/FMN-containing dehydrogenase